MSRYRRGRTWAGNGFRHSEDISGVALSKFGDWSFVMVNRMVEDLFHHCNGTKGIVLKGLHINDMQEETLWGNCVLCNTEVPEEIRMMLKVHEVKM